MEHSQRIHAYWNVYSSHLLAESAPLKRSDATGGGGIPKIWACVQKKTQKPVNYVTIERNGKEYGEGNTITIDTECHYHGSRFVP